jgi:hypothetical protein
MRHTELNRYFALFQYLLFAFFFILAMAECLVNGHFFHIPLFSFFILAYITGAYSALTYKLLIESRILYACIVIATICFSAHILLLFWVDVAFVIRTMMILMLNAVWFVYRLKCVLCLYRETIEMNERGDVL